MLLQTSLLQTEVGAGAGAEGVVEALLQTSLLQTKVGAGAGAAAVEGGVAEVLINQ